MNKTILNQRVSVIPYHFEDSTEKYVILRDEETGRVCVETGGGHFFFDSWDEMLFSTDCGMVNARLGCGMWLEYYLIEHGIQEKCLENPKWLEDDLMETLENHFGIGAALWLAEL